MVEQAPGSSPGESVRSAAASLSDQLSEHALTRKELTAALAARQLLLERAGSARPRRSGG